MPNYPLGHTVSSNPAILKVEMCYLKAAARTTVFLNSQQKPTATVWQNAHTSHRDILSFPPPFFSTSSWHPLISLSFLLSFLHCFFLLILPFFSLLYFLLRIQRAKVRTIFQNQSTKRNLGASQYSKEILLLVMSFPTR